MRQKFKIVFLDEAFEFLKELDKVPDKEIKKAKRIRQEYFRNKNE